MIVLLIINIFEVRLCEKTQPCFVECRSSTLKSILTVFQVVNIVVGNIVAVIY